MTVSSKELINAIAKVNDLTRRGLIKWQATEPVKLADSIGRGYEAVHEGRRLRLIAYSPPRVRGFFQSALSQQRVFGVTALSEMVLEILDDEGHTIFEFPKVQGISDLFETIELQLSDVEEFIKSLIASP